MLALKKKREAEQKAAAAEASSSPAMVDTSVAAVTPQNGDNHEAGPAKISLLGIGGIKKKDTSATGNNNNNNNMKKRTPGEIRIQKGNLSYIRPHQDSPLYIERSCPTDCLFYFYCEYHYHQ